MKVILSLTSSAIWKRLYPKINAIHVKSPSSINSSSEGLILVSSLQNICDDVIVDILESSEKVIIFYQQAEHWISEAISDGKQVADSLDQWRTQVVSLLDIKKKNRQKIDLINLDQLIFQPRFELILGGIIGTKVQGISNKTEINPYHFLLAKQAVQQADLTSLNTLLFASSEAVGNVAELTFDIQKLIDENNATFSKMCSGQEKNTLFSKELVIAHDEVHSLNEIILELRKRIDSLKNEQVIAIKARSELVKAHEKLLTQQLSACQVLQIEKQSLLNELEDRISAEALIHKEFTLTTSTLTKNLLKEQESIKRKNEKLHSFSQKNKKLLTEIATLNESSDTQTQHIHELMEKKRVIQSESTVSQKKLYREFKKTQSELNLFKAKNAAYIQKINKLETEMTAIKESVLWKTSAPIRALSNIISKNDRKNESLQQDLALLMSSKYFDMKWYLKTYPDVAATNINPAEHYLKFGAEEGRYCSPIFDAIWYLNKYPDVAESAMNPLLHFIKYGEPEGRKASPKLLELNVKK